MKKQLEIIHTLLFGEKFGNQCYKYAKLCDLAFSLFPYRHFVFTYDTTTAEMVITVCDTHYGTDEHLEQSKEVKRFASQPFETFWFIVDDYDEKFVGTMLMPEDY